MTLNGEIQPVGIDIRLVNQTEENDRVGVEEMLGFVGNERGGLSDGCFSFTI